jgi:hypothetical protein
MGGPGSGWGADEPASRAGRKKRNAVSVCGSGEPIKPSGISPDVSAAWDRVVEVTEGTTFSQDSLAIEEMADLLAMRDTLRNQIKANPADLDIVRTRLAVGRGLTAMFAKFGLTPRDRQVLLVPREDDEKDDLEQLMAEREEE